LRRECEKLLTEVDKLIKMMNPQREHIEIAFSTTKLFIILWRLEYKFPLSELAEFSSPLAIEIKITPTFDEIFEPEEAMRKIRLVLKNHLSNDWTMVTHDLFYMNLTIVSSRVVDKHDRIPRVSIL